MMARSVFAGEVSGIQVPCVFIRTIAEGTNEDADVESEARFKSELAVQYNYFILQSLLQLLAQ
jgi:hypothetical protein